MGKAVSSLKYISVKIKVYSTRRRKEKLRTQRDFSDLLHRITERKSE